MTSYAPGYGVGPFGLSPFGVPAPPWEDEPPTVLHSSRKVDLVRGIVESDNDGNPRGMDDVGQRVVLAVQRAKIPELQGIAFDEEVQQEIRRALAEAELTTGSPPDIDLFRQNSDRPIEVEPLTGGVNVTVHYRNNLVGTETSVTVGR
jgi:hypothetical protein